ELDERVQGIIKNYPKEDTFREALVAQAITFKDWRSKIEFSMLQKKVMDFLKTKAKDPEDTELREYYKAHVSDFERPEQIKIRQIVLKNEADAKRIEEELHGGKNMGQLAQNFSITPEASAGGIVGWVQKGTFEAFDDAFKLRVGQTTPTIKT